MWLKFLSGLLMVCLAWPVQAFAMPAQIDCPMAGMMADHGMMQTQPADLPDCCQTERVQQHCQDLNHCSASYTSACNSNYAFTVEQDRTSAPASLILPFFSQQRHSIWRPPC